ncbi:3'5'-cyclic nucleotide phosphodiesterase [Pelomyxa schiedti]|nr:3'5'-cyclic nucleotide phosphodiesterase [Pelomyxa schiedti]
MHLSHDDAENDANDTHNAAQSTSPTPPLKPGKTEVQGPRATVTGTGTRPGRRRRRLDAIVGIGVAVGLVVVTAGCVWATWFSLLNQSIDTMTNEEMKYSSDLIETEISAAFQVLTTQVDVLAAGMIFNPQTADSSHVSQIWPEQISLLVSGKNHISFVAIPLHPETFDPYIEFCEASKVDIIMSVVIPFADGTGNLLVTIKDNSTGGLMLGYIVSSTTQERLQIFLADGNISWPLLLQPALNATGGVTFIGPAFLNLFGTLDSMIFMEKVIFSPHGYPLGWAISGTKTLLLSDMLGSIEFRDGSFGYIIDSVGLIVCAMGAAKTMDAEIGTTTPDKCNDTKISNSMEKINRHINTTSLLESVYLSATFDHKEYQIAVSPMYPHKTAKWTLVIAISAEVYKKEANFSSRIIISIAITLGLALLLVGVATFSSIKLSSNSQSHNPQTLDLESGITKVISALHSLKESSDKRSKKLIAEIIMSLTQTTSLFMPDLKNQAVLFDKDIQKWLDEEIAPTGFSGPTESHSVASSQCISLKGSRPELQNMDLGSLDFPLFDLPSEGILENISMQVLEELDVLKPLNIPTDEVRAYINEIEHLYQPNYYHNQVHAADVVQCLYYLLVHGLWEAIGVNNYLDVFILIISGVVHDVGHPGVNNAFLIATEDELAMRYNDKSVLENFHSSVAVKLFLTKYTTRWNLTKEQIKQVRTGIISLVLSTDVSQHFEIISKFKVLMENPTRDFQNNRDHRMQLMCIAIKTADISNVMRPHDIMLQWVKNLTQEFFAQGDQEQAHHLPLSPFADRSCGTGKLAKLQTNFVGLVAKPLAAILNLASPAAGLLSNLEATNDYWSDNPAPLELN